MSLKSPYLLLGVVMVGFVVLSLLTTSSEAVYCKQSFAQREQQVVLFGTQWCGYCRNARNFFAENNIAYCEYDVEATEENQQIFTELGGNGVPLILVGDEKLDGFNKAALRRALQDKGLLLNQKIPSP